MLHAATVIGYRANLRGRLENTVRRSGRGTNGWTDGRTECGLVGYPRGKSMYASRSRRGTSIIRSFAHFIVARPPAGNFSPTLYELPSAKAALGEGEGGIAISPNRSRNSEPACGWMDLWKNRSRRHECIRIDLGVDNVDQLGENYPMRKVR